MTEILYFDMACGISGDMCLGALIDMGVDLQKIINGLGPLGLDGYKLSVNREKRKGIIGTRCIVTINESTLSRNYSDIKSLIEASDLTGAVKGLSLNIFKIIAKAEGKVHGVSPEEVHFHEVGALDSIIDIVGTALAIDSLNIDLFYSSPVTLGTGQVNTEHGLMPVPAPATMEILKDVALSPSTIRGELTTPTGAAIVKALSRGFGPIPAMKVREIGYGVGSRDNKEAPNILRLFRGSALLPTAQQDHVHVIETNIDDMNPQIAGFLMQRLFDAGALDVYFTPVQMKKSRPGILLSVLTGEDRVNTLTNIIFTESTSIGVRSHRVERKTLTRTIVELDTPYGKVRVKVSRLDGNVVNILPEYEDLLVLNKKSGEPLKNLMEKVTAIATEKLAGRG